LYIEGFFVLARDLVTTPVEGVPSVLRLSGRLIDARSLGSSEMLLCKMWAAAIRPYTTNIFYFARRKSPRLRQIGSSAASGVVGGQPCKRVKDLGGAG
jgi:hypothetical protein